VCSDAFSSGSMLQFMNISGDLQRSTWWSMGNKVELLLLLPQVKGAAEKQCI
jgi:hypothetical protein